MQGLLLSLNAGSSSLKFGVYDDGPGERPRTLARGALTTGSQSALRATSARGDMLVDRPFGNDDLRYMLRSLLSWIDEHFADRPLMGCGHRIVHGGTVFADPVQLTPENINVVKQLTPLAPLHQPRAIEPIEIVGDLRPDLFQVGCFDTAFHRTMTAPARQYALPRAYQKKGICRFGFHGISYEYVAQQLLADGLGSKRTIVAHLGSGASLCAMRDGRSVDTTMGFSALEGLVMATRCGSIDPGLLLYLLQNEDMSPADLEAMLYTSSGLLGVSGRSGDIRELETSGDPAAEEAIELFVFMACREIAALANSLDGLDCLVFTAGIGEHSAPTRQRICRGLNWLGLDLDENANVRGASHIALKSSAIDIRIIPTHEEIVIAEHARSLLDESEPACGRPGVATGNA